MQLSIVGIMQELEKKEQYRYSPLILIQVKTNAHSLKIPLIPSWLIAYDASFLLCVLGIDQWIAVWWLLSAGFLIPSTTENILLL